MTIENAREAQSILQKIGDCEASLRILCSSDYKLKVTGTKAPVGRKSIYDYSIGEVVLPDNISYELRVFLKQQLFKEKKKLEEKIRNLTCE